MTTKYIGIIYVEETKEIRAVFNPAYDEELDDPDQLKCLEDETRKMLKLLREDFPEVATPYYLPKVIERAKEWLQHNSS